MVVLVDGGPGVNLQTDLVTIFHRCSEAVEGTVIQSLESIAQRCALFRRHPRRVSQQQRFIFVGFWIPKVVFVPFALRPKQLASVKRPPSIEYPPVNLRPSAGP